jgi:cell division protein FtsI/penicillin-binding protein 2
VIRFETYENYQTLQDIPGAYIDVGNYRTEKGFGNVDSSTLFPMASVTKVITATAILQLVQNGRLDLAAYTLITVSMYNISRFEIKELFKSNPERLTSR